MNKLSRYRCLIVLFNEIVRLEKIVKIYRVGEIETKALRGIDLVIYSGDYIAIMGPSGSGKSTLLNIIGLLDVPSSGKVYVLGHDVSRLNRSELAYLRNRVIGFVFQTYNLIPRYTVLENIELPLMIRNIPRRERIKRVIKALEMIGGDPSWLAKKPMQLSGGQQQRVAIARAIVTEPKLILADEPTGNLDRASSRIVVETFNKLNKNGQTIVVVTHDPEIANCTKKIYILRDGLITEEIEPDPSKCILKTMT